MSWTCDKENDCENGTDETHCGTYTSSGGSALKGSCVMVESLLSHMLFFFPPVQISFAHRPSSSAGITAVSPAPGCVMAPMTVEMAQMRAADAVSHNSCWRGCGRGEVRGLVGPMGDGVCVSRGKKNMQ